LTGGAGLLLLVQPRQLAADVGRLRAGRGVGPEQLHEPLALGGVLLGGRCLRLLVSDRGQVGSRADRVTHPMHPAGQRDDVTSASSMRMARQGPTEGRSADMAARSRACSTLIDRPSVAMTSTSA